MRVFSSEQMTQAIDAAPTAICELCAYVVLHSSVYNIISICLNIQIWMNGAMSVRFEVVIALCRTHTPSQDTSTSSSSQQPNTSKPMSEAPHSVTTIPSIFASNNVNLKFWFRYFLYIFYMYLVETCQTILRATESQRPESYAPKTCAGNLW